MDAPPALADRPRYPAELASVRDDLDALFRATPMYAAAGIQLGEWGPGWARVHLEPTPAMANLAGSLHGGATFALADAAFEVACNSWGRMAVALETSCHYHRPAPLDGRLQAEGWEVARGGRTATYRLQVVDGEGQLLTSYLALAYRTSRWHVDAARLPDGWA